MKRIKKIGHQEKSLKTILLGIIVTSLILTKAKEVEMITLLKDAVMMTAIILVYRKD